MYCTALYFAIKTRTSMLITKHYGWTTRQNALTILQLINRTRPSSLTILETYVKFRQVCPALFELFRVVSCFGCQFYSWCYYCYVSRCNYRRRLRLICSYYFLVCSYVLYVFISSVQFSLLIPCSSYNNDIMIAQIRTWKRTKRHQSALTKALKLCFSFIL